MATRKRKGETAAERRPVLCGNCVQPVDREAVLKARRDRAEYVHGCGRVLVRRVK